MLLFWTFSSQNDPTVEVVELLSPARLFLFECLKHSLTTRDWSNDRSCNGSSESGPVLVPCGKNQLHGCILRDTRKDQHRHERKSWMSWINLDLQLTRMTKESGTMEGCMIMQFSCNVHATASLRFLHGGASSQMTFLLPHSFLADELCYETSCKTSFILLVFAFR